MLTRNTLAMVVLCLATTGLSVAASGDPSDERCDRTTMNFGIHFQLLHAPLSGSEDLFADLNNDGFEDIVYCSNSEPTLEIRLGMGGHAYRMAAPIFTGSAGHGRVIDVNGDGHLDLLLAESNGRIATALLIDGESPTGNVLDFEHGWTIDQMQTGDFTGDGIPDVVVLDQLFDLVVYPGLGNGEFDSSSPITSDGIRTFHLHIEDFNGDGLLDAAMASRNGDCILISLGDGLGQFHPQPCIRTVDDTHFMLTGDVDLDGDVDLVIAHRHEDTLDVYLNDGAASFTLNQVLPVEGYLAPRALVDLDEDGALDIVAVDFDADSIRVIRNDGNGQFQLDDPPYACGAAVWSVVPTDANDDGHIDLRILGGNFYTQETAYGRGDGTLVAGTMHPTVPNLRSYGAKDLDLDGLDDIVTIHEGDESGQWSVRTLLNTNLGTSFELATEQDLEFHDHRVELIADATNDGIPDLILSIDDNDAKLLVLPGVGDGSFHDPIILDLPSRVTEVHVGDSNGDGYLDLLIGGTWVISTFVGDMDGNFTPGDPFPVPDDSRFIRWADMNADGHLDLCLLYDTPSSIGVMIGTSDWTFEGEVTQYPIGANSIRMTFEDFNHDGFKDLAVNDRELDRLVVHLSDGQGGFVPGFSEETDTFFEVFTADLDDDGFIDLIQYSDGWGAPRRVSFGIADGDFLPSILLHSPGRYHAELCIADFDGNGAPDFLTGQTDTDWLTVELNSCSGRPACHADLNSDDQVDIDDLLIVIAAWSTDGGDVNFDNTTDVDDLLIIINSWGPCP